MEKGGDRLNNTLIRVQHTGTGEWVDVPEYLMLDTEKMSVVTGLSVRWFELRRSAGDGPRYYACTNKKIRYLWPDWVKWLGQQSVSPYAKVFDAG